MSAYILIFAAVVLADLATTWYGLRHGYHESNPLFKANPLLLAGLYNVALFAVLCFAVAKFNASDQGEVWLVISAIRALPVGWNIYQLWK